MTAYISRDDSEALAHYGVKGMRWYKHLKAGWPFNKKDNKWRDNGRSWQITSDNDGFTRTYKQQERHEPSGVVATRTVQEGNNLVREGAWRVNKALKQAKEVDSSYMPKRGAKPYRRQMSKPSLFLPFPFYMIEINKYNRNKYKRPIK